MRAVQKALGVAAAVALPPAEALAVAQAVEAMVARGLPVTRLRAGVARGLVSGATILGSCLPR